MFKKFTRLLLTVRQADRKVEGAMPLFIVHTVPLIMHVQIPNTPTSV